MKHTDILEARGLLGLPDTGASMDEIRSSYPKLVSLWHPDRCREDKRRCEEMTRKIIAAHEIIAVYCENYEYSFAREEARRHLSGEEWWFDKFGNDPLWGNP